MDEEKSIVTLLLIGLLISRPVAICTENYNNNIVRLVHAAVKQVFAISAGFQIDCTDEMTGKSLAIEFNKCHDEIAIIRYADRLGSAAQAKLAEILMKTCKKMLVVVIGNPDEFSLFLKEILFVGLSIKGRNGPPGFTSEPKNVVDKVRALRPNLDNVVIIPEVTQYMVDIITFLRCHRLVKNGVSPQASKDVELLVRAVCVLNKQEFATPTIIDACSRRLLPLKIEIIDAHDELSIQYGSDVQIVQEWIAHWTCQLIVDSVIANVSSPF